MTKKQSILF